jgi:hypothetical protein
MKKRGMSYNLQGDMRLIAQDVCEHEGHSMAPIGKTEYFCVKCCMTRKEIRGEKKR